MNLRGLTLQLSGYTLVQVFAIFIEYVTYTAAIELFGLWVVFGNIIAKITAGAVAVVLHSKYVFEQDGIDWQTIFRYFLLLGFNTVVTSFLLSLVVGEFGPYWAKILSDCIMVLINFFISKTLVFRKN